MESNSDVRMLNGRYELEQSLVEDGPRRVWRAFDRLLETPVVVKGVLGTRGSKEAAAVEEEFRRLIAHPHPVIARAYDIAWAQMKQSGKPAPFFFFTQEWIQGSPLTELRQRLSVEDLHQCLTELLEVVAFLHQRRLVCLDIKPAHLFRTDTGWRLIDLDQARVEAPMADIELAGTLNYLAPEVLAGRDVDARSDIYSVGALLYEAVTGAPPEVRGNTIAEVLDWLEQSQAPLFPERFVEQAPHLASLGTRLLARNPTERPASAEEALTTLSESFGHTWRTRAPIPESELIGRDEAWKHVHSLEDKLYQSGGGHLVITGPARSGKSRMLREIAIRWQLEGRPVLRLEGSRLGGRRLELMRLVLEHLSALGKATKRTSRSTRLDIRSRPRDTDASLEDIRQHVVRSTLSDLIHKAREASRACDEPIPILVDDLQDVDELSLQVLRRLAAHLPGSGLLVAWSAPAGAGAGAEGDDENAIVMRRLSEASIRALAEDVLGPGAVRADEIEHLRNATDGAVGWIRDALGARWRAPGLELARWTPEGEGRTADGLLDALTHDARRVAQIASVFDIPVPFEVIEAVIARDPFETGESVAVAQAVYELVRAGLLCSEGKPPDVMLHFPRELLRLALFRRLSDAQRQSVCLWAAEALEQSGVGDANATDRAVARYYLSAGLPDRARGPLHRAHARARDQLWLAEGASSLRELIGVSDARSTDWLTLHVRLGEILYDLGQFEDSHAAFVAGLEADGHRPGIVEAQCRAGVGRALTALGKLGQASDMLRGALEVGSRVPAQERLKWWYCLAWIRLCEHDIEGAREVLREAEREGIPPRSRYSLEQVRYEAWVSLDQGQIDPELITRLEQARRLAAELEHTRGELDILNLLMQACQYQGKLEQAQQHADAMLDRAHKSFDLAWEGTALVNLGYILRAQCRLPEAYERFDRAAEIQARIGNAAAEARSRMAAADILLERGLVDRVDTLISRSRKLLDLQESVKRGTRFWLELLEIRLAVARGQFDGLQERLQGMLDDLDTIPQPELKLSVFATRMELELRTSSATQVLRAFRAIPEALHNMPHLPSWRRIHQLARQAHEQLARDGAETGAGTDTAEGTSSTSNHSAPTGHDAGVLVAQSRAAAPAPRGESVLRPEPVQARLQWLDRIRRLLAVSDEDEFLAAELARQAGELLSGRGLVFFFEGASPQVVSCHGMTDEQVDDVSSSIIERVRKERRPFACDDILADREVRSLRSLRAAGVRSVLCCPVVHDGVCIGVIYVDRPQVSSVSTREGLALLGKVAELASELLGGLHQQRRRGGDIEPDHFGLVGNSAPMRRLKERIIELVEGGDPDLEVLLLGETGTGKSFIARKIHEHGTRRDGPFHTVDCAAVPEGLFEELMFGHRGGIFTGARHSRGGWFEQAEDGTLFLDEIGEMPVQQQAKLLKTLGDRRYCRMGDADERSLNIHLICATNRDLRTEVQAGRFKDDLLRRIFVNVLEAPPLRERGPEDICLLARHYITLYLKRRKILDSKVELAPLEEYVSPSAKDFLCCYHWPWNVGEVQNLFRNASIRRRLRSSEQGRQKRVSLEMVQEALGRPTLADSTYRTNARAVIQPAARQEAPLLDDMDANHDSGELVEDLGLPVETPYASLQEACEVIKRNHVRRVFAACGEKLLPTAEKMNASRDVVRRYVKSGK